MSAEPNGNHENCAIATNRRWMNWKARNGDTAASYIAFAKAELANHSEERITAMKSHLPGFAGNPEKQQEIKSAVAHLRARAEKRNAVS